MLHATIFGSSRSVWLSGPKVPSGGHLERLSSLSDRRDPSRGDSVHISLPACAVTPATARRRVSRGQVFAGVRGDACQCLQARQPRPSVHWRLSGIYSVQGQNRTGDTWIFSPLLYRLSYLDQCCCYRPRLMLRSGCVDLRLGRLAEKLGPHLAFLPAWPSDNSRGPVS
jgi:hypothetical protein